MNFAKIREKLSYQKNAKLQNRTEFGKLLSSNAFINNFDYLFHRRSHVNYGVEYGNEVLKCMEWRSVM